VRKENGNASSERRMRGDDVRAESHNCARCGHKKGSNLNIASNKKR
jgi:hypothetical protein